MKEPKMKKLIAVILLLAMPVWAGTMDISGQGFRGELKDGKVVLENEKPQKYNENDLNKAENLAVNIGARLGAYCAATAYANTIKEILNEKHPSSTRTDGLYMKCIRQEFKKHGYQYIK
jgi:hypothetical protein